MNDTPLAVDTGVLLAIAAATDGWEILECLPGKVIVTPSVWTEIRRGPPDGIAAWCECTPNMQLWPEQPPPAPWLARNLDPGEASVIALALEQRWPEVAIDEARGRSAARAMGLKLTGSLGLLIRAKKRGYPIRIARAIKRMLEQGIWLSDALIQAALEAVGELPLDENKDAP